MSEVRYAPRALLSGMLGAVCPYSGHYTYTSVGPSNSRIECTCGVRFQTGIILWPIARGHAGSSRRNIPPDWVIPIPGHAFKSGQQWDWLREAVPTGDLGIVPWRRHHPSHVLVNPSDATDLTPAALVRGVRRLAEAGRSDDFHAPPSHHPSPGELARLGAALITLASEYNLWR